MPTITDDQLDRLGQLVDKADGYLALNEHPLMPSSMALNALRHGLESIHDEIKALYLELSGKDEWSIQLEMEWRPE